MTATPVRTDPEKHKEQVRAANRARHRAVRRLILEDPERFNRYYAEEAAKEGVTPQPRSTASEASILRKQIDQLTGQLSRLVGGANGKGATASR